MERFVVPLAPTSENSKPATPRPRWKHTTVALGSRFESAYRRELSPLLVRSYSEVGVIPHSCLVFGTPCLTSMLRVTNGVLGDNPMARYGVSDLQFDNKGIFLASVTKSGCLMIDDFETLYCQCHASSPCSEEDEPKYLFNVFVGKQLDAVQWNPVNQDEVACTSLKMNEVLIFDIAYASSDPVAVLRQKPTVSIHGNGVCKGLSDIILTTEDNSRVIAADTNGSVNIWDRRMSEFPCLELATNSHRALNSIEWNTDNQTIFGADRGGFIYMWDIRGGRTAAAAFSSSRVAFNTPFQTMKLASIIEKIQPLKVQSNIVMKEIHSIDKDPSSTHRLAFHLDDGWSGVLDVSTSQVTHIHCPPPAWLNGEACALVNYPRKPSWLSFDAIYAIGSAANDGIFLLDFYPDFGSPCHVDYREDIPRASTKRQNRFISLSEGATVCAVHPLNGSIVVGTKEASLIMVSQKRRSWKGENDCLSKED